MSVAWMLVSWVRDYESRDQPMDVVCWMPPEPGVPKRCLCGYNFPTPDPDAHRIQCDGPWRHVWADALDEIGKRIEAHSKAAASIISRERGESGRSASAPAPALSTEAEDKTPVERPDSNKDGRSPEYGDMCECGHPRSLHAGDKGADTYCEECGCKGFRLYAVEEEAGVTLTIREVPACTSCGRVGHLAADCPNN